MLDQVTRVLENKLDKCSPLTVLNKSRSTKRLYLKLYPYDTDFDHEKLSATPYETVYAVISQYKPFSQKDYAACMLHFCPDRRYTDIINAANLAYTERINSHVPSDSDTKNAITPVDIELVEEKLRADFDSVYEHTKTLYTHDELHTIRNYLCFQLVSGRHFPPRRSKDWTEMKLCNVDTSCHNYIEDRQFVFVVYKTCKHHGTQRIDIPDEIYDLICIWRRVNSSEWLIPTNTGKHYYESNFNLLVNGLFGSTHGKSTTQLRKSYLQSKFGNLISLSDTMEQMGSSHKVINSYVTKL